MAKKMFGVTHSTFLASLEASWEVNHKTDEVSFSVGVGRSVAKPEMRIAPFLNLCEVILDDSLNPDTINSLGRPVWQTIEIETADFDTGKVDEKDGKPIMSEQYDNLSYLNPTTGRRNNIAYADAVCLLDYRIIDAHLDMVENDDPRDAFFNTFERVKVEADEPKNIEASDDYTFRLSFAKNQRTIRVPVGNWADFLGSVKRAYDYITTEVKPYNEKPAPVSEDETATDNVVVDLTPAE